MTEFTKQYVNALRSRLNAIEQLAKILRDSKCEVRFFIHADGEIGVQIIDRSVYSVGQEI